MLHALKISQSKIAWEQGYRSTGGANICTFHTYVTVLESAISPERAFIKSGSDVTFKCLAFTNFANLSVQYEWLYPSQLDPRVTVNGPVLMLQDADSSAEVNFTCTVMLEGTALVDVATSTLVIGEVSVQ